MNTQNYYRIVSVFEDVWNFTAEFEIKSDLKFTPTLLNSMLLESAELIYKNGIFETQLNLSYYSHYVSDDIKINSNIILEADILKQTNNNLIAECYLYDKLSNQFLAKAFFVYASQI